MQQSILMSFNEAEFKALVKEAVKEVLRETGLDQSQQPAVPEILSVKEAAAFLKLKVSTMYEKTADKLIPHLKKGKKLYFYRTELEAWLNGGKVKTAKELQYEAATFAMKKHA